MKEYEIIIETINPCGGTKHAQNEIIEAEAESPEAYVKEHGIFPVMDVSKNYFRGCYYNNRRFQGIYCPLYFYRIILFL